MNTAPTGGRGHTLELPYGRQRIQLSIPADYRMERLTARLGHALADPDAAVLAALRAPQGRPPLREWVQPGERIAIVTSDVTRPALQHTYMPHILAELQAAGVLPDDVLIVIGVGTHRAPTAAEVNALLGEAAERHQVAWSDCDDADRMVDYGRTSRGTHVRIFRPVAEAGRVILTGSINHHVMAGFSAGPKSLLPGVAARESILANHALALNPEPPGGLNAMCDAGILDGNPMQEDFVEALERFRRPVFLVNVVPAPEGGLLQAVAGDPIAAHRQGCRTADEYYAVPIPERRPLVVASCGGHPADLVCYQATKGLINMGLALLDGGVGLMLAECSEGIGSDEFAAWARLGTPEVIERELRKAFTIPGRVAHYLASLTQRATIVFLSSVDPQVVRELGMLPAASPAEALRLVRDDLPARLRGYVMNKASVTAPVPHRN